MVHVGEPGGLLDARVVLELTSSASGDECSVRSELEHRSSVGSPFGLHYSAVGQLVEAVVVRHLVHSGRELASDLDVDPFVASHSG